MSKRCLQIITALLCALRIRTGKWIHDVTLPQGEL